MQHAAELGKGDWKCKDGGSGGGGGCGIKEKNH